MDLQKLCKSNLLCNHIELFRINNTSHPLFHIENYVNDSLHKQQKISGRLLSGQNVSPCQISSYCSKIEVSQLIENEMDRYSISHLHLWFINDNIDNIEGTSQDMLLISMAKYLADRKNGDFTFQYVAEKYGTHKMESIKNFTAEEGAVSFSNNYNSKSNLQFGQSTQKAQKLYPCGEITSNKLEKQCELQEKLMNESIKFQSFKQFELFIKNQTTSNPDEDLVKEYIFKKTDESVRVSFMPSDKKYLIKHIVEEHFNRIQRAKLKDKNNSTKLFQYQNKLCKKEPQNYLPQNTFHKIILFLFTNIDKIDEKAEFKKKKSRYSPQSGNMSIEALFPWKIREEDIDMRKKYEKECSLIKQEIQNQKLIFRNKIRIIENYIGDTIDIEKLIQEEEDLQSSTKSNQNQNGNYLNVFSKKPNKFKRSSILPNSAQRISTMQKINKFIAASMLYITSEFNRLKELAQFMRSIDNILQEQNKKIDDNKIKLKELGIIKEQIILQNAKDYNQLKYNILTLQEEIKRKEFQIQEKKNRGTFQAVKKYKNKSPSAVAQQTLHSHISFINKHQTLHQTKIIQGLQSQNYSQNSKVSEQHNKPSHQSNHRETEVQGHTLLKEVKKANIRFRQKKWKQTNSGFQKNKSETVQKNGLDTSSKSNLFQISTQLTASSNSKTVQIKSQNMKLHKELIKLYEYYQNNCSLIGAIKKQVDSFKCLSCSTGKLPTKNYLNRTNSSKYFPINKNCQIDQQLYEFNLSHYPIVQEHLTLNHNQRQLNKMQKRLKQIQKDKSQLFQFKEEIKFQKDYFMTMFYSGIQNKKSSAVIQSKCSQLSQSNDKIVKPLQTPQTKQPSITNNSNLSSNPSVGSLKASKFKRITIEQSLNANCFSLKRSKF